MDCAEKHPHQQFRIKTVLDNNERILTQELNIHELK